MSLHVTVTGGAGYIGSILCEHLLYAGHKVTVVDNLLYRQNTLFHLCSWDGFEFIRGDVRDAKIIQKAISNADVIIPLAAIVGASACSRDPWLADSVNLHAVQMLNRLRSPEQLVIYPNTNSGYGTRNGSEYCTEETPMDPISLYGRTKVEAERLLLDSPNVIALRLATVFGMSPRMRVDLLVNHFVYAAMTDHYLVLFEKDFKRNFVHIRDVADCFLHCIVHAENMAGKPFNLGLSSANLTKEELALKIREYIPQLFIHCAEIGEDPDKRNYVVDHSRLKDAGFEARRSLDDGIQELIRGYQSMGTVEHGNA